MDDTGSADTMVVSARMAAGAHRGRLAAGWRVLLCNAARRAGTTTVVSIEGCFVDVRPPERLSYTWNWNGAYEGMPETFVTVEFQVADAGTDVVVTHQNFPDARLWHKHRSGWIDACDRMERTLISN